MTILILCLGLAVPAFAEETEGFANEYPRVIDNAELLSTDERELLTSKLDEISTRQKVDVTVATTDTLDGLTVSDYAERFYESHNYGYGCLLYTSVLTPQEVLELLNIFRDIRKQGKTIIFITHKLNETKAVSDSLTVLRAGKSVFQACLLYTS